MDKLLQMIGMAKRAGKTVTGGFLAEKAIKSGESKLIVVSKDISEESRKSVTDACKYYKVKYIEYADREQLGKITGGGERTVISINDYRFAEAILKIYSAEE